VKSLVALILVMLASATAHAQVVKCVGPDGRVEYTNVCPPGTTEHKIGVRSAPASPAPDAAPQQNSLAERDAAFRKRQIEQQEAQQKAAKQAAEAEQKRQACDKAQAYLKSLEAGMRIARTDPKTGERVFLEDAEYAAETARARRAVEQTCN
jgi:hypothetical protein